VQQKYYLLHTLHKAIKAFHPKEIICTWWDPWGYLAILLGHFAKIPVICVGHGQEVIHSSEKSFAKLAKNWLRSYIFRRSALVVAVSNFTKSQIESLGVKSLNIKVIPNGLMSDYIKNANQSILPSNGTQNFVDRHVILQVGRLVSRKGHETVLQALTQIRGYLSKPVVYIIVGAGPQQEPLMQLAQQLGLQDGIIFTGFIPDENLHHYYRSADVVVMPSHNPRNAGDVEGFGIVYLEAYAHAKPVIGVRAGGVPDVIQHEETGVLIPPGDVSALAKAFLRLLNNPEEAKKMGEKGRERLNTEWEWGKLCQEFLLSET
jgi:phosphatidyl-myo-inositol dimannoside synthase